MSFEHQVLIENRECMEHRLLWTTESSHGVAFCQCFHRDALSYNTRYTQGCEIGKQ